MQSKYITPQQREERGPPTHNPDGTSDHHSKTRGFPSDTEHQLKHLETLTDMYRKAAKPQDPQRTNRHQVHITNRHLGNVAPPKPPLPMEHFLATLPTAPTAPAPTGTLAPTVAPTPTPTATPPPRLLKDLGPVISGGNNARVTTRR